VDEIQAAQSKSPVPGFCEHGEKPSGSVEWDEGMSWLVEHLWTSAMESDT